MKKSKRYDISGQLEAQFEPGSRNRVLKNIVGITRKGEMNIAEAEAYALGMDLLFDGFDSEHRFTAGDICYIHKVWLGNLYGWAGQYRNVNVTKEGFTFAAAGQIDSLMAEFEKKVLRKYTPCTFLKDNEIVESLAIVHAELMLIHPFREGNGRVGRLLAVLMAVQAGLPGLDFSTIRGKTKKAYFSAVRSAMELDYRPMQDIFNRVLLRTRKQFED
jgi:cell filamentation protein